MLRFSRAQQFDYRHVKACKTHETCGNLLILSISAILQVGKPFLTCGNHLVLSVSAMLQTHKTFEACGNPPILSISAIRHANKLLFTCGNLLALPVSARLQSQSRGDIKVHFPRPHRFTSPSVYGYHPGLPHSKKHPSISA